MQSELCFKSILWQKLAIIHFICKTIPKLTFNAAIKLPSLCRYGPLVRAQILISHDSVEGKHIFHTKNLTAGVTGWEKKIC